MSRDSEPFVPATPQPVAVCTTPWKDTHVARVRARQVADWFGCPAVERKKRSVLQICADEGCDLVVVADQPVKLFHRDSPDMPLFFHPGMAQQRVLRIRRGEPDRLIAAAQIRAGDIVVDATLGLGADSLVLAEAVSANGQVIALESMSHLAQLFTYEQVHPGGLYPTVRNLLARIQVRKGENALLLAEMDDDSVDVVYFDPMFRHPPRYDTPGIDTARAFTDKRALSTAAWEQAKRVARRCVVLKERPFSGEFERFGLSPDKPRSKVAFGVWWKESAHEF